MAGVIQVTASRDTTGSVWDAEKEVFSGVPNACVDKIHEMVTEHMVATKPGFNLTKRTMTQGHLIESGGRNRLRIYQHGVGLTVNIKGVVIDLTGKFIFKMDRMSGDLVVFPDDKWQDLAHFYQIDRENHSLHYRRVTLHCESK